jgi:WD40 repeat protein
MTWEQAPTPRRLRPWLWPGIAIAVLIAVVAFVVLTRSDQPAGTLTIGPTADPAREASEVPSVNPSDFAQTPLDPLEDTSEVAGDGPLLPDGPDVTVITTDDQNLRSINVATGDFRRTGLLAGADTQIDPWRLFAVGDSVITNSGEDVVRITSPDHRRTRLARNHTALTTLDDDAVWVLASPSGLLNNTVLRVGFDGTIGNPIELPAIAQPQAGAGDSVFVWTPSGIHAVSGEGVRRITSSGLLAAVSTDQIAWFACAADLTCQIVVGTHDDPDQVRMPVTASDLPAAWVSGTLGRFSPDGRRLALPLYRAASEPAGEGSAVVIIDTATGAQLTQLPEREGPFEGAPLDWSPDSQWLFVAAGNRISAWNAGNGDVTEIATRHTGPIRGLAVIENR